ncbi:MAG: hypothetical protein J6Y64_03390 [Ruminococcus sp.]|nr:hypothetical protein [Ruminococcus sp.]
MSEFNSKGCKLSCGPDPVSPATTVTYKKLYGLHTIPEMGGSPERLDVTNLEDSHKRSILGLGDVSDLNFGFYATKGETDTVSQVRDTWNVLQAYETAGTVLNWKLEYPDGNGWEWKGSCHVKRDQVTVNTPIKFTLAVGLETDLDPLTPAAPAQNAGGGGGAA